MLCFERLKAQHNEGLSHVFNNSLSVLFYFDDINLGPIIHFVLSRLLFNMLPRLAGLYRMYINRLYRRPTWLRHKFHCILTVVMHVPTALVLLCLSETFSVKRVDIFKIICILNVRVSHPRLNMYVYECVCVQVYISLLTPIIVIYIYVYDCK